METMKIRDKVVRLLARIRMVWLLVMVQMVVLIFQFSLMNVGTAYAVRWELQRMSFIVLESQAILFNQLIDRENLSKGLISPEQAGELNQICKDTGTRLTLIDRNGNVIYDSHSDYRIMENHGDRPEFSEALGGQPGQSIRFSETLQLDMQYFALPVVNDKGIVGALRVCFSVYEARRSERRIISLLGLISLFILLLMFIFAFLIFHKVAQMIKRMEKTALNIAYGDYDADLPTPLSREETGLQEALSLMSRKIREQQQELRLKSHYDSLTGLGNRRLFDEMLSHHWKLSLRGTRPVSLILLDIDNFKKYNDALGHPAGDECLRKTAEVLMKAAKRSTDFIIRYGGEEFAVLLPDTEIRGAIHLAQRIREGFKEEKIDHPNSPTAPYITLSMGIHTQVPTGKDVMTDLVKRADQALYRAKEEGRNRFEIFTDATGE